MRLSPTDENLRRAGECIARGGLVAFPTETVYGLGADAFDAKAEARIFEAKARPSFDPLIVHVASIADVKRVADAGGRKARALMATRWPGPLHPGDAEAKGRPRYRHERLGDGSGPLSRPSRRARDHRRLGHRRRRAERESLRLYLADLGEHVGEGSAAKWTSSSTAVHARYESSPTVLDMTVDPPMVLRPGGMPAEAIEAVIGPIGRAPAARGPSVAAPPVPASSIATTPRGALCS